MVYFAPTLAFIAAAACANAAAVPQQLEPRQVTPQGSVTVQVSPDESDRMARRSTYSPSANKRSHRHHHFEEERYPGYDSSHSQHWNYHHGFTNYDGKAKRSVEEARAELEGRSHRDNDRYDWDSSHSEEWNLRHGHRHHHHHGRANRNQPTDDSQLVEVDVKSHLKDIHINKRSHDGESRSAHHGSHRGDRNKGRHHRHNEDEHDGGRGGSGGSRRVVKGPSHHAQHKEGEHHSAKHHSAPAKDEEEPSEKSDSGSSKRARSFGKSSDLEARSHDRDYSWRHGRHGSENVHEHAHIHDKRSTHVHEHIHEHGREHDRHHKGYRHGDHYDGRGDYYYDDGYYWDGAYWRHDHYHHGKRDLTPSGMPGFVEIAQPIMHSSLAKQMSGLVFSATSDENGANFTVGTSQDHSTQFNLVAIDDATTPGADGIYNLRVPVLDSQTLATTDYCATFSTQPPSPLSMQPCGALDNAAQTFSWNSTTGQLQPVFAASLPASTVNSAIASASGLASGIPSASASAPFASGSAAALFASGNSFAAKSNDPSTNIYLPLGSQLQIFSVDAPVDEEAGPSEASSVPTSATASTTISGSASASAPLTSASAVPSSAPATTGPALYFVPAAAYYAEPQTFAEAPSPVVDALPSDIPTPSSPVDDASPVDSSIPSALPADAFPSDVPQAKELPSDLPTSDLPTASAAPSDVDALPAASAIPSSLPADSAENAAAAQPVQAAVQAVQANCAGAAESS